VHSVQFLNLLENHKAYEKSVLIIQCVFSVSLQLLFGTFHCNKYKASYAQAMCKNECTSSCKVLVKIV
jgi:hypothetical protein